MNSPVSSSGSAVDVLVVIVVVVELSVVLETGSEVVELDSDWVVDWVVDKVVIFSVVELEEGTDVVELEAGLVVVVEELTDVELWAGFVLKLEADSVGDSVGDSVDVEDEFGNVVVFVGGRVGRLVVVVVDGFLIELNRSSNHWKMNCRTLFGLLLSLVSALNFSISRYTAVSLICPSAS